MAPRMSAAIRQQIGWFIVMATAAIFVIFYMSMYQIERDRWSRLMREIPSSTDDLISHVKGHVSDEILLKLHTWAKKVEGRVPDVDPWEAEQSKRKEYIRKVCYEVRAASEVKKPSPQDMLKYMVLDNVDNVIFCPSLEDSKATDWQHVLLEYAERALRLEMYARGSDEWDQIADEYERADRLESELVEEGMVREDYRNKFREVMNAKSVQEVLGSYYIKANTKVLLVEHPFERLLSFYLETIRDQVGKTGEKLSKKILGIRHGHDSDKKSKKKMQVSFPQFMHYLLYRVAYDPHLKALYYICHPCDIQYDYIIKMETFHEDITNINARIRSSHEKEFAEDPEALPLPERKQLPYFNLTDEAWVQAMLYSKYSKIRSDQLLQAFDLFSIDIFLFNYSWPFEKLSLTKDKHRHR
ncbi:hypothetical protein LSH36_15g20062 [Paralvinella palmiformis]|uniref:Carbohydrate sulfotransferase n=1 Tax=Paralvinella palmiformis TaxID=53620 RepID=A0AAD9KCB6_9ANNE|nr:hypothetical protein LSH36_15g20062 [Paralvinella palmiformis]